MSAAGGGGVGGLLVACRYLTAVPMPAAAAGGDLGRAAAWFPVVGLALGALLAGAALAAAALVPAPVGAVVVVGAWAALTGGLHLDGLADTADGLGGGFGREAALAIMRDARIGAYGVTAVVLVVALKLAALASLSPPLAGRGLLAVSALARLGPVLLARLVPPARAEGAGRAFAGSVTARALALGSLVAGAAAVGSLGPWGLLLLGLTGAGAAGFGAYLRRRLGGHTGDCLGALVEATEAGLLAVLAALEYRGAL